MLFCQLSSVKEISSIWLDLKGSGQQGVNIIFPTLTLAMLWWGLWGERWEKQISKIVLTD